MSSSLGELLEIERELAQGDGVDYRRHLREDAVVIVPGQVLDRDGTVAAMDASPGWDRISIENERLLPLGADAATIAYCFRGHRGDFEYRADMASTYVRDDDGSWQLVVHQQTPAEEPAVATGS